MVFDRHHPSSFSDTGLKVNPLNYKWMIFEALLGGVKHLEIKKGPQWSQFESKISVQASFLIPLRNCFVQKGVSMSKVFSIAIQETRQTRRKSHWNCKEQHQFQELQ